MALTDEIQVLYYFCGFTFKEANAEILLKNQMKWESAIWRRWQRGGSSVFRRSSLLPPFLAVSTFTALLSKSFRSSWVSRSQRMFPLRKQHIPCLFLSCHLLFLITGWGWAGVGLSSGQCDGLSLPLITMFSSQQFCSCCTWCSGPKWTALLIYLLTWQTCSPSSELVVPVQPPLCRLGWYSSICKLQLGSAANPRACQDTSPELEAASIPPWRQNFEDFSEIFKVVWNCWFFLDTTTLLQKKYFYIYVHMSRLNYLWICWLRGFFMLLKKLNI